MFYLILITQVVENLSNSKKSWYFYEAFKAWKGCEGVKQHPPSNLTFSISYLSIINVWKNLLKRLMTSYDKNYYSIWDIALSLTSTKMVNSNKKVPGNFIIISAKNFISFLFYIRQFDFFIWITQYLPERKLHAQKNLN